MGFLRNRLLRALHYDIGTVPLYFGNIDMFLEETGVVEKATSGY